MTPTGGENEACGAPMVTENSSSGLKWPSRPRSSIWHWKLDESQNAETVNRVGAGTRGTGTDDVPGMSVNV